MRQPGVLRLQLLDLPILFLQALIQGFHFVFLLLDIAVRLPNDLISVILGHSDVGPILLDPLPLLFQHLLLLLRKLIALTLLPPQLLQECVLVWSGAPGWRQLLLAMELPLLLLHLVLQS